MFNESISIQTEKYQPKIGREKKFKKEEKDLRPTDPCFGT